MRNPNFLRIAVFAFAVAAGFDPGWIAAQERTDFPAQARKRYEQGKDLQKKGLLDEAIQAFDEAIKLGMDEFPRVHLQRASSNFDLQKFDTAIAEYTRFINKFGLEQSCRY